MEQFKTVAFHTLGCKLNFSETSTIARSLEHAGYARVDLDARPDLFVLNTCSVTENADKKCRQFIQKARQANPDIYVIVTGCFAQLKPQAISESPDVDLVLGANEKFDIAGYIESMERTDGKATVHAGNIKKAREFVPAYSYGDRTRTFLKVQDGCDYFCSFCTIPLARGRSRSASVADTLTKAREVARTEVREVVLTGVNIGDFGKGAEETFYDLIRELDRIEGIDRFRISSIEPDLLSPDIIRFVAASEKFVPHFHIPLQSGSDKILGFMRRRYDTALYQQRVEMIRELMPDCCIGVDVITGTPGEGEAEFLETYEFLNRLDVSYLHVFTYSERANTKAAKMEGAIPWEVRKERSKMLRILSQKKKRAFYEQQQGKQGLVLFEAQDHEGYINGFTKNYVKVKLPYNPDLINQVHRVSLDEVDRDGLMKASLLSEETSRASA